MSLRAQRLHETADRQIAELAERLSADGETHLARPCPGRDKLGDGTVGAVAAHTTDNYHRIARFLAATVDAGTQQHSGRHGDAYRATAVELDALLVRLAAARDAVATIAQLSDEQLDLVPPAGEMKFADGERTLEQIVTSLLKHQRHQVAALAAALS
jgi:hypothetical protein